MRIKKTSQYIEGGASLPSYSTNEIKTDMKWIDGKPLYKRVLVDVVPTTSTSGTDVSAGIFVANNTDEMIIEWGYVRAGTTSADLRKRQLPFTTTTGYRIALTAKCDSNGGAVSAPFDYVGVSNSHSGYSGREIVISVLYTKTTD